MFCSGGDLRIEDSKKIDIDPSVTLNNSVLYNAMIYPFTRMVIKGTIWYQGSNH
jgi:hypothetical protein